MRAALAVHTIDPDRSVTLGRMIRLIRQAALERADLVVFSETALTGFVATDDADADLRLGDPIPGNVTDAFAGAARTSGIWVAAGVYEREGDVLYDAAVLISPDGKIALRHRRQDGRWHYHGADPIVYGNGDGPAGADTALGCIAFLICGEFVHAAIVQEVSRLQLDWLIVPFARGYDEDANDDAEWYGSEIANYGAQARAAGVPTLMTNHIHAGRCFGGAMAFDSTGRLIDHLPLHTEGLLVVDI